MPRPTIRPLSLALLLGVPALFWLTGCADQMPSAPGNEDLRLAAVAESGPSFGPFPGGTTIFVDVANTTDVQDGSRAHPFHTLRRGLAAAKSNSVVGMAAGVYADEFGPELSPNYVIDGLSNFRLLGSGAQRTIIRGNHSFSLIRVVHGSTVLIRGVTIEKGGDPTHSVGGGIQAFGAADNLTIHLALANVILRHNTAVSGGALAADGNVVLHVGNVVAAENVGTRGPGAFYLNGINGRITSMFVNTTITRNTSSAGFGGVHLLFTARLDAANVVLWNNAPTEITTAPGGQTVLVRFSDIAGRLYPGFGNLSVDPVFVNPAAGNFRLFHTSPLIDAGVSTPSLANDVIGKPRPVDGDLDCIPEVDMGAYEFGLPSTPCSS
jgi:hypothetical protein